MDRRSYLKRMASAGGLVAAAGVLPASAAAGHPIQLHVELQVKPGHDKELERNYRTAFVPIIRNQPGFVEVKLLRLREPLVGSAPTPYRLVISFDTEDQRRVWVASDAHQRAWPAIGKTLESDPNTVSLYDTV